MFWKWSCLHLQGIMMPRCPWKCHLWGTFYKLYKIKSLTSFSQEDPSEAQLGPPANPHHRGEGMSVGFGLPTQSLQRCMRLHINCIEFGQPWASIAFVLNITEKYEMEITFSTRAFFPKLCRDAPIPIHQNRIALVWSPRLCFFCGKVSPAMLSEGRSGQCSLAQLVSLFPFLQISAFSLLLFLLMIHHPWGSQNQPHTQKNWHSYEC